MDRIPDPSASKDRSAPPRPGPLHWPERSDAAGSGSSDNALQSAASAQPRTIAKIIFL